MKNIRQTMVGAVGVGGTNPVRIQSMCNTDTRDVAATVKQIRALAAEGCEIIRVAVPDETAAQCIGAIKKQITIPLVADIHFDYRLAIRSIEQGADKIRINPGNIGGFHKVREVVNHARDRNVAIRIGVNTGSLDKKIKDKYGKATKEAMVESVLEYVDQMEQLQFSNLVLSMKASSVPLSIEAYSLLRQKTDYPLHIGITEAGTLYSGTVKSAVGIGALLSKGIGETLRVSLTGDPLEEIRCAKEILQALQLRFFGPEIISCPTCGRTEIPLIQIANEVEKRCRHMKRNIKIAVMGCVVNGPGEAQDADIGIAGGKGQGILFQKGKVVKKVPESQLVDELMKLLDTME